MATEKNLLWLLTFTEWEMAIPLHGMIWHLCELSSVLTLVLCNQEQNFTCGRTESEPLLPESSNSKEDLSGHTIPTPRLLPVLFK